MPSPTATAPRPGARERLLAAADELFYAEGIHTVGIDRVIEHAGVAKASLYSTFGSKDELVRAYLQARLDRRRTRILTALAPLTDPRARILAVFDVMAAICAEPGYRGCAFANASAEGRPGSAEEDMTAASRTFTRTLFEDLAVEAGVADPALLGRQLVQLYDGAMLSARMDHDGLAPATAKATATVLLDALAD